MPPSSFFRRAVKAFESDKLEKAASLCEQTLENDPVFFDALHLLGVTKSKLRHFEDALVLFERALALRARHPDVLNNRGSTLVELGRFPEALDSYDGALAGRAKFADAHNNRGCVLMFMERHEDALASYGNALILAPDNAEYMNNMGRALTLLLRYDEALDCFDDAIALKPGFADAMLNRGRVLEQLQVFNDAVVAYGDAMDAGVSMIDALLRRAGALKGAKRYREALSDYNRALRLEPERHDILLGRSETLAHLGQADAALAGLDQAAERGVDRRHVLLARCFALNVLERRSEAIETGRRLVEHAPHDADAQNTLGFCLMDAEHFDEAIVCFQEALALKPAFANAEWNLGYLSLLRGRFAEGFRHYEGRRRLEGTRWTRLAGPEWAGEPLAGKRILLYAEQAFGDTIHFARYVGVFADLGADVVLGVYAPLAQLMRGARGLPEIALPGENVPAYDYHLPLMSAPHVLGHDEKDTPGQPYLFADAERTAAWADKLPAAPLRVGIAWQGSLSIPGRSVPLAAFAPLARVEGVALISLQKSDGLDQLASLPADMNVHTLGADFDKGPDAFLDTAAVMMNLDLVISVDTAIAHLAGALGCPEWIVLKTVPDWRWMLERSDSPWYPSARLFRRKAEEDWQETMETVAAELAVWADAKRHEPRA